MFCPVIFYWPKGTRYVEERRKGGTKSNRGGVMLRRSNSRKGRLLQLICPLTPLGNWCVWGAVMWCCDTRSISTFIDAHSVPDPMVDCWTAGLLVTDTNEIRPQLLKGFLIVGTTSQ